jgi:hypothetical protein
MPDEKNQSALNDQLVKVTAEANGIFTKLAQEVEKRMKDPAPQHDVLDICKKAGLNIDEAVLKELQIDRFVFCYPWLPWHVCFPWRPIWCWWWHRFYPWYRCCPWWWHRCHWHPHIH